METTAGGSRRTRRRGRISVHRRRPETVHGIKEEIRDKTRQRKPVLDEEKKGDFFLKWQPQLGVVEDNEEEEGYWLLEKMGEKKKCKYQIIGTWK